MGFLRDDYSKEKEKSCGKKFVSFLSLKADLKPRQS